MEEYPFFGGYVGAAFGLEVFACARELCVGAGVLFGGLAQYIANSSGLHEGYAGRFEEFDVTVTVQVSPSVSVLGRGSLRAKQIADPDAAPDDGYGVSALIAFAL